MKISSIFIFIFLIISGTQAFAGGINPAYLNWLQEKQKTAGTVSAEPESGNSSAKGGKSKLSASSDRRRGLIPSVIDKSKIKGVFRPETNSSTGLKKTPAALQLGALPDSYDLRTNHSPSYLSDIRDQNPYGNCWTYATYASLEANLRKDKGENNDFNEYHMSTTHGFNWGINEGGNSDMAAAFLSNWKGPVDESTSGPVKKHLQNMYSLPVLSTAAYGQGAFADQTYIENIKRALITYGPVFIGISAQDRFADPTFTYFYANDCNVPLNAPVEGATCTTDGHAVAIIGWNDNISTSSFAGTGHTPAHPGAFIVRNSWGTGVGESGYFYMSYDDTSIGMEQAVFDTPEDTDNYKTIYSYDDFGNTYVIGCTDIAGPVNCTGNQKYTAWAANIFTAEANGFIKAVSFYTTNQNADYELYLSTVSRVNMLREGYRVLISSGRMNNAGYHTIRVPESMARKFRVRTGSDFAAVIRIQNGQQDENPLAVEYPVSGYSMGAYAGTGQSYYSPDGVGWQDLTSYKHDYYNADHSDSNFPIKVFVDDDNTGPVWTDPYVWDGTGADISVTENDTVLSANWSEAHEEEETEFGGYMYAIGTAQGLTDVVPWTDNGVKRSTTVSNLPLVFGQTYYFGVKAYNEFGTESEAIWSDGQRLWYKRPHPVDYVADGLYGYEHDDIEYIGSTSTMKLTAHWPVSDVVDPESEIEAEHYLYAIGTSRGGTDIQGWQKVVSTEASSGIFRRSDPRGTGIYFALEDGKTYYYTVVAVSTNGKHSLPTMSDGQTVDITDPEIDYIVMESSVTFGPVSGYFNMNVPYERLNSTPVFKLIDHAGTPIEMTLSRGGPQRWEFDGVIPETAALGQAGFQFQAWTKAGHYGQKIPQDSVFYIVKYTGDDHSEPLWPSDAKVRDGLSRIDSESTSSNSSLSANWDEAYDYESGIDHYEYRIGTSQYDYDVRDWTSTGKQNYVTAEGLSLSYGTTYYFTIRAVNRVDLVSSEIASNGQWVDESKPGIIPVVYCSENYDQPEYINKTSSFTAHWAVSDQSVGPDRVAQGYDYILGTTSGGDEITGPWENHRTQNTNAILYGLNLKEETDYYFSVRAYRNHGTPGAPDYRYSDVATCKVTVDTTPPNIAIITRVTDPQDAGSPISGTLRLNEPADRLSGVPELYFSVGESVVRHPLNLELDSDGGGRIWNFSGYVDSTEEMRGSASFGFLAVDKAGNTGTTINNGGTFTINALRQNASSDLVFRNDDGCAVSVPAGTVDGDIRVTITPVNKDTNHEMQMADIHSDSIGLRTVHLPRDFKAYDGGDNLIPSFSKDLTITFPYPDEDNDGRTDGDYLDVNTLFIHHLSNERWVPLANSVIDRNTKTVSAKVGHFSIYSLRSINGGRLSFNVAPSPNPCHFTRNNITFRGIPAAAQGIKVYIYNTAGELVRDLPQDSIVWDGRTKNGSMAASGVYIYLIKTSTHGKARGKFYAIW